MNSHELGAKKPKKQACPRVRMRVTALLRVADEDEARLDDADGDRHQGDEHDPVAEALVLLRGDDVEDAADEQDAGADEPEDAPRRASWARTPARGVSRRHPRASRSEPIHAPEDSRS